jgi:adenosylhomocysteinase
VESHRAGQKLPVEVIDIPVSQDEFIAELKLSTMGLTIDKLTNEQIEYASNYQEGT